MSYHIPILKVCLVRDGSQPSAEKIADRAEVAASLIREFIGSADREHFVVLLLNARNAVIGIHTVSIGTLTASLVHPREVFKPAILANAAAAILGHNHPSGDCSPSPEDKAATRRIKQAGELLGISVLDHIIIGDAGHFSFREGGIL